jgi:hypothetical protein
MRNDAIYFLFLLAMMTVWWIGAATIVIWLADAISLLIKPEIPRG